MAWSVEKKHGNLPRRRPEDPFERIWAHYHDLTVEITLSDKEKERLEIYEFAVKKYEDSFTEGEIAKAIMIKFGEEKGEKIPPRTAYNYIHDALDLFGRMEAVDLNYEKRIFINRCKMAMRKCEKAGEWKTWATINQTLAKIYNFNEVSDELTDYLKKFKPIAIIFSSDPKTLQEQADELVKDIDFEEMNENGAGGEA